MRSNSGWLVVVTFATFGLLVSPLPAVAGNNKETASELLKRLDKELQVQGMDRVTGPVGTNVREGSIGAVAVKLEQARPYRLTVIGDDDAAKIAVVVVDRQSKRSLLKEVVEGRVVQGGLSAPFTGSYEVAVRIGQCNVQPCGFRVMLHALPSTGIRQMSYAPIQAGRPSDSHALSGSSVITAAGERR